MIRLRKSLNLSTNALFPMSLMPIGLICLLWPGQSFMIIQAASADALMGTSGWALCLWIVCVFCYMVPHCVLRIHVNQNCISLCILKKQTDVYYAILISVTIPYFLFFLVIYSSIFFHFQEEIEFCQTHHLQKWLWWNFFTWLYISNVYIKYMNKLSVFLDCFHRFKSSPDVPFLSVPLIS